MTSSSSTSSRATVRNFHLSFSDLVNENYQSTADESCYIILAMNFFDTKNNRVVFPDDHFLYFRNGLLEVGGSYTQEEIQIYVDYISTLGFEEVSVDGIVDEADGITTTLNFSLFECTWHQVEKCNFINQLGGRHRNSLLLPKSIQEQALMIFKENKEVTPWLLHGRVIKDLVVRWYEEQGYISADVPYLEGFPADGNPELTVVIFEGFMQEVNLVFIEPDHADHKNKQMKDIQMKAHKRIRKKLESQIRKILFDYKVVPGQIFNFNNSDAAMDEIVNSLDLLYSIERLNTLNIKDPDEPGVRKLVINYKLFLHTTNPPWAKLR